MPILDLPSRYFQIAMKPEDIVKTVFITNNGYFAFKRMSFNLLAAPFTFQMAMNTILKPLLSKGVFFYLNDKIAMATAF